MTRITWKPIKGYIGYYEISNKGTVKSLKRNIILKNGCKRCLKKKILKSSPNSDGYKEVTLSRDGKDKDFYVHRLVAQAFLPNPDNLPEVNHKSGIKTDNTAENLEWVTHQANVIHAYKTGLSKNRGGSHRMAIGVIDNTIGQKYDTIKEWCDAMGIKYSTGRNILSGWNTTKIVDLSKIVLIKHSKDNSNGK